MFPPSELCRIQEMAQRALAASDPLPNVRLRAERAAAVWQLEGVAALKREQGRLSPETTDPDIRPEDDMSGPDPDDYIPDDPRDTRSS